MTMSRVPMDNGRHRTEDTRRNSKQWMISRAFIKRYLCHLTTRVGSYVHVLCVFLVNASPMTPRSQPLAESSWAPPLVGSPEND